MHTIPDYDVRMWAGHLVIKWRDESEDEWSARMRESIPAERQA